MESESRDGVLLLYPKRERPGCLRGFFILIASFFSLMQHSLRHPLRFEPYFRTSVWGNRRIAHFLGKNPPLDQPCGESWEVSDHPLHRSKLVTATHFGVTLRHLMEEDREDLLGPAAAQHAIFPWLIKLLDANDWLSVQVHPDTDTASRLCPGECAKTEAWYVLDALPESRIWAGLLPGVGPRELRQALERDAVIECLYAFTPRPGDFLHLPAGTVHAVGGGVLIAEVQQTSDATYRLFDWNRRDSQGRTRALHVEESLACIHWEQGPIDPIAANSDANDHRTPLIACPFYAIEHLRASKDFELGGLERLQALIVTAGQGRFDNGEFFMPGDAWILPAAMPKVGLHVETPLCGLVVDLVSV
jgi:mannose-6-phosphate isomerase